MVFSSVIFLFFFLPVALALAFFPWNRWRNGTLVLVSLAFFAWGGHEQVFVLCASIGFNYLAALALERAGQTAPAEKAAFRKKAVLAAGIAANLGLLVFYKYAGFIVGNLDLLLGRPDAAKIAFANVHAPLGISFFTFHALSYLVDVYRGDAFAEKNPFRPALYLSFFPKILAGPILPFRDAQRQLGARVVSPEGFASGIERFIVGFAKKVLIANPLAAAADRIFAIPAPDLTFQVSWLGIACFSLQILFDFAGYTDMAVGLGKMFGFELPENFNYPYISQSVQEFWRRWHISLSSWFRDYLYIPLGGNRCSKARQYVNLATVFLLCGLWHGASWNFVVWGLWYGLFLVLERAGLGSALKSAWRPLRHLYALAVIVFGWVFFRSETLAYALGYFKAMLGFQSGDALRYFPSFYLDNEVVLCLIVGAALCFPRPGRLLPVAGSNPRTFELARSAARALMLGALFFLSCMALAGGTQKSFIYFQF
jgi:alginate O-acetyltransferase complex protein AlgI